MHIPSPMAAHLLDIGVSASCPKRLRLTDCRGRGLNRWTHLLIFSVKYRLFSNQQSKTQRLFVYRQKWRRTVANPHISEAGTRKCWTSLRGKNDWRNNQSPVLLATDNLGNSNFWTVWVFFSSPDVQHAFKRPPVMEETCKLVPPWLFGCHWSAPLLIFTTTLAASI